MPIILKLLHRSVLWLFIILLFSCGETREETKEPESIANRYYILFDDVSGLLEGSEVLILGMQVGAVENMTLHNRNQILVTIELEKEYVIPVNSKFRIDSDLLGTRHVTITFSDSPDLIIPGDTLTGIPPTYLKDEFDKLMQPLMDTLKANSIIKIVPTEEQQPLTTRE